MKPLSNDLRERIIAAVDHREDSRRHLALRFCVSVSCITRLLQLRRETGALDPRPHGGGKPPTLDQDGLERLRGLVQETPDATLQQLRQSLGVTGSIMIVCRGLRKLVITRKKKTQHATEQDRPEVQRKRRLFREKVERISPKRLVFADETGVMTAMTPAYGRAPRGERVVASAPASWESVTLISAVRLDGIRASLAVPGSSDGATSLTYVEGVLARELRRGDVVIFDNLGSHLAPEVAAAIERAGAKVLRLPPYSPDFNPIEAMFSKLKESLRRAAARTKQGVHEAIGRALKQVSAQDILGWFRNTGLCATHP